MKKFAVIVAGGSGQRMNAGIPKQFLLLKGKPLIWYTLQAFLSSYNDLEIILVLPEANVTKGEELIRAMKEEDRVRVVAGGDTRFQSVKNGLNQIKEPSVIFIHDGVRCLVAVDLIQRCFSQALEKGSAIPAVVATDSLRMQIDGEHKVVDRSQVRLVQTPQTFRSNILLPAFEQPYDSTFTDEATVVEASGQKVFLIDGEYNNIKITHPIDLVVAEKILDGLNA